MSLVNENVMPDAFGRIHDDLARVASRHLRGRGTLDVPAVVAEVYVRLCRNGGPWENTGHFYSVACKAAGQVVANHHRGKQRHRRGGGAIRVTLHAGGVGSATISPERFIDLQRALDALERVTPRMARVVSCRAVAGLSVEETAEVLAIGTATVKRDWRAARAFLARYLEEDASPGPSS